MRRPCELRRSSSLLHEEVPVVVVTSVYDACCWKELVVGRSSQASAPPLASCDCRRAPLLVFTRRSYGPLSFKACFPFLLLAAERRRFLRATTTTRLLLLFFQLFQLKAPPPPELALGGSGSRLSSKPPNFTRKKTYTQRNSMKTCFF
jgi:hypothetical protein